MLTLETHQFCLKGLSASSAELCFLRILCLALRTLHSERPRAESVPTVYGWEAMMSSGGRITHFIALVNLQQIPVRMSTASAE